MSIFKEYGTFNIKKGGLGVTQKKNNINEYRHKILDTVLCIGTERPLEVV